MEHGGEEATREMMFCCYVSMKNIKGNNYKVKY